MMSVETILYLSRAAAVRAAYNELEPYVPDSPEEPLHYQTFPFPNLGQLRPAGWWLISYETVDATGFDPNDAGGPALSVNGCKRWVSELVREDPTAGFAIIESGQFQVVVGYFSQDLARKPVEEVAAGIDAEGLHITECPECGEPIEEDSDYCPWCEADLTEPEPDPFKPGDLVTFDHDGYEGEEGRVDEYDSDLDEVTIEVADGHFYTVDVDSVRLAYDPDKDSNQLRLPL